MKEITRRFAQLLRNRRESNGGRVVIVLSIDMPLLVYADGTVTEMPDTLSVQGPARTEGKIGDLNGVADAFCGGFLAQLALQSPIGRCVERGMQVAQVVSAQRGCTFPKLA